MIDDIAPRFGGRNLVPAHGAVNGNWRPVISTGANGFSVVSLSINGVALAANQLAALGLDQDVAPGKDVWVADQHSRITAIEIGNNTASGAGDAYLYNNELTELPAAP